jgi:hypothetical protein
MASCGPTSSALNAGLHASGSGRRSTYAPTPELNGGEELNAATSFGGKFSAVASVKLGDGGGLVVRIEDHP